MLLFALFLFVVIFACFLLLLLLLFCTLTDWLLRLTIKIKTTLDCECGILKNTCSSYLSSSDLF